jgi:hypothetical protein
MIIQLTLYQHILQNGGLESAGAIGKEQKRKRRGKCHTSEHTPLSLKEKKQICSRWERVTGHGGQEGNEIGYDVMTLLLPIYHSSTCIQLFTIHASLDFSF